MLISLTQPHGAAYKPMVPFFSVNMQIEKCLAALNLGKTKTRTFSFEDYILDIDIADKYDPIEAGNLSMTNQQTKNKFW